MHNSLPPGPADEAFLLPHLLSFAPFQGPQRDVAVDTTQTDSVDWSLNATSPHPTLLRQVQMPTHYQAPSSVLSLPVAAAAVGEAARTSPLHSTVTCAPPIQQMKPLKGDIIHHMDLPHIHMYIHTHARTHTHTYADTHTTHTHTTCMHMHTHTTTTPSIPQSNWQFGSHNFLPCNQDSTTDIAHYIPSPPSDTFSAFKLEHDAIIKAHCYVFDRDELILSRYVAEQQLDCRMSWARRPSSTGYYTNVIEAHCSTVDKGD